MFARTNLVDLHISRLLIDVRPVGRRGVALQQVQEPVAAVALLKHLGPVLQHRVRNVRVTTV